uniref:Uncharacterized protein n=1 Tax=Anopheles minimus TaxID=112268 RepID=A0A182WEF1_9DIPT
MKPVGEHRKELKIFCTANRYIFRIRSFHYVTGIDICNPLHFPASEGELEEGGGGPTTVGGGPAGTGDMMEAVGAVGAAGGCEDGGGGGGGGGAMLLFGTGGILAAAFASAVVGEVGCWVGVGETEMGRVGGELEAARGWGLLLRLRAPAELEPGVTASNADPSPDGKLYGENR